MHSHLVVFRSSARKSSHLNQLGLRQAVNQSKKYITEQIKQVTFMILQDLTRPLNSSSRPFFFCFNVDDSTPSGGDGGGGLLGVLVCTLHPTFSPQKVSSDSKVGV